MVQENAVDIGIWKKYNYKLAQKEKGKPLRLKK